MISSSFCCVRNKAPSDAQYFNDLITLSSSSQEETDERINELLKDHSDNLIADLIVHPEHREVYRKIGANLKARNSLKPFQSSLGYIQRIAFALQNHGTIELDTKGLDKISEQISEDRFSDIQVSSILCRFSTLKLSDIDEIKAISHPLIRISVIAALINRDRLSIETLQLSKKELLQIGPHLTYLDCRNSIDSWSKNEIDTLLDSCINVKTLIISSDKITRLPDLKECEELYCPSCINLKTLPELLKCCTLDCSGCENLAELPKLPRCQNLCCSRCEKLREIPYLPLCETLVCDNCLSLSELPFLPLCHTIDCSDCFSIKLINALPLCKKLYCNGCISLSELPLLSLCECLNCKGCFNLIELKTLPNCQFLDCSKCINLIRVKALPVVERFICKGCIKLKEIPLLLLFAEFINCKGCINLSKISELPVCQNLDCSECINLTKLPNLPLCHTLHCKGCISLTELPSLPFCETLDCRGSNLRLLPTLKCCTKLLYSNCSSLNLDSIPLKLRLKQKVNLDVMQQVNLETHQRVLERENHRIYPEMEVRIQGNFFNILPSLMLRF